MDGFKSLPKMAHFKDGGHVKKEMCKGGMAKHKEGGKVAPKHEDVKEDKKLIKKAFGLHDSQLHEDKKTDLSTLKRGGRAKKETGTVKKYKAGGAISGSKGPSGAATELKKVAPTGNKKAKTPSKASVKPVGKVSPAKDAGDATKLKKVPTGKAKEVTVKSAAGKGDNSVKKFAVGGTTGTPALATQVSPMEKAHQLAIMQQMKNLPPYMQLQLMNQQQAIGGQNSLNQIAGGMSPQSAAPAVGGTAPTTPYGQ